jgi:hypothetical protein
MHEFDKERLGLPPLEGEQLVDAEGRLGVVVVDARAAAAAAAEGEGCLYVCGMYV